MVLNELTRLKIRNSGQMFRECSKFGAAYLTLKLTPTDSEGNCHVHWEYNGLSLNIRITDYEEEPQPNCKQAAYLFYQLNLNDSVKQD